MEMPKADYVAELGALALASRLRRLLQRLHSDGEQVYRNLNLDFKPKWFPVIHLLAHRSALPLTELAGLLSVTHPSLIETVRELVAAGLVNTRKSDRDGRRRELSLSREGKRLCIRLQPVWGAFGAAGEAAIKEGNNDLLEAVGRFERALDNRSMYERIMMRVERRARKQRKTGNVT